MSGGKIGLAGRLNTGDIRWHSNPTDLNTNRYREKKLGEEETDGFMRAF